MKKRKLKKWVIYTIQFTIGGLLLYLCFLGLKYDYDKSMNYCTSQGNSVEYCERMLFESEH